MKTRNENRVPQKAINTLFVGECFAAKRSGSNENGIYLKIDKNSGNLFNLMFVKDAQCNLAVNLETGQLRNFNSSTKVTPLTQAEVVY